jgi:hypothetical protein
METVRIPWRQNALGFWFCVAGPSLFWLDWLVSSYVMFEWLFFAALCFLGISLVGVYYSLGELLFRLIYARDRYVFVWLGLLAVNVTPIAALLLTID